MGLLILPTTGVCRKLAPRDDFRGWACDPNWPIRVFSGTFPGFLGEAQLDQLPSHGR